MCVSILLQAFSRRPDVLVAGVDWILGHSHDPAVVIPFSRANQLRIVSAGCSASPGAVATYFQIALAQDTLRHARVLETLRAVDSMLRPTRDVVASLCDVLPSLSLSRSSSDLGDDEQWQEYLLVATAMLGRLSGSSHDGASPSHPSVSPPDLEATRRVITRCVCVCVCVRLPPWMGMCSQSIWCT